MPLIVADVRQAFRRLAQMPLLSCGAILTLTLGIGSAVAMVDVLDRLLLRPPEHVRDPERVARVYIGTSNGSYVSFTGYRTFEALAGMREEFVGAAVHSTESLTFGRGQSARQLAAVGHSDAYFTVLGLQPALGAWPDATPAREDTAVISHALWQQEFGGSRDVLGQPIRLGTDTYTIAAVAPQGFAGLDFKAADVWLPLGRRARAVYGKEWQDGAHFLQVIARLRPDVSRERASQRATAVYRARHTGEREQATIVVGDLRLARAPGTRAETRVEVLVAGLSIVVLLVTCGNVANVLLVRGLRRERELAVKSALGASRTRLLYEVMLEAAVLAAVGGAAALVVVTIAGGLIRNVFLPPLAALASPLDMRLLVMTAGFCIAAAFLLGLAPALHLSAHRSFSPARDAMPRPSRILDVLSGLQVALSLPMIVAAGLFVVSLWNARHQDFGMQTSGVAVLTTNLAEVGRPTQNHDAHRLIQERVMRFPQVESTALVQSLLMRSQTSFMIEVPGKDLFQGPAAMGGMMPSFNAVDPSMFTLMRMRLVDGRFFTEAENRREAPSVAVISETMARNIWAEERAVGKCFYMREGKDRPCTEVIGVVADARLFPSIRPTKVWAAAFYVPIGQLEPGSGSRALLVRTSEDPDEMLETLRREAQVAAPDLPFVSAHAFDEVITGLLRPWRLGSIIFVAFGALSILIAAVGLAVVGTYGVTRRTREIGIRSALGATPQDLVGLVLGRILFVVVLGLGAGAMLAYVAGRVLTAQLFDITATDPRIFASATLGLLAVAGVAAWIPARRAAHVDPVIALRAE